MYLLALVLLVIQYFYMEFEKDIPATDEQIALANSPKVTVAPITADIQPEATNNNFTHQNEAAFTFEAESTDPSAIVAPSAENHHIVALLIAGTCALCFAAGLAAALFLR